jgi:hypothetical protein
MTSWNPGTVSDLAEARRIGLERVASSIPEDDPGAASFLSVTVAFFGDGVDVQEADVLQKAADYFRQHPELVVQSAHWTRFQDDRGDERYQLEFCVVPPTGLSPQEVARLYPRAER